MRRLFVLLAVLPALAILAGAFSAHAGESPAGTTAQTAAAAAPPVAAAATQPTPTLSEQCKALGGQIDKLQAQLMQTIGARSLACAYSGDKDAAAQ